MTKNNNLINHRALLILGMHRSGTSAWTRLLNIAGLYLGDDLLGSNTGNLKGHWEHNSIMLLNNYLLDQIGHSWDSTHVISEDDWKNAVIPEVKNEIINKIKAEFGQQHLWGIKDPRLCRLVPIWRSILVETGISPSYLLVIRHPVEVAVSLNKRNGFPIEKGILLWLINMLEAERETRGERRCFVSYQGLLQNWESALEKVDKKLGLGLEVRTDQQRLTVSEFITPSLQHNKIELLGTEEIEVCGESLILWAETAYKVFLAAVDTTDAPGTEALDLIYHHFKKRQSVPLDYGFEKLFDLYRITGKNLVELALDMTSPGAETQAGKNIGIPEKSFFYNKVASLVIHSLDFTQVMDARQAKSDYGSLKQAKELLQRSLVTDPSNPNTNALLNDLEQKVFSRNFKRWQKLNELKEVDGQLFAERMMLSWLIKPEFHFIMMVTQNHLPQLARTIEGLNAQFYKQWRLTIIADLPVPDPVFNQLDCVQWLQCVDQNQSFSLINAVVSQVTADWVCLIPAGFRLLPHSLLQMADHINLSPQWLAFYTDEAKYNSFGECVSHQFKPDFNLDYMRSYPGYLGFSCFIRKDALLGLGGYIPGHGGETYDVFFKVYELYGDAAIGHIAFLLADFQEESVPQQSTEDILDIVGSHLQRLSLEAELGPSMAAGGVRITYRHSGTPLVSIIVAVNERTEYLSSFVSKLVDQKEYPNVEFIFANIRGIDQDLVSFIRSLEARMPEKVTTIDVENLSSYSRFYNIGAAAAKGEFLLFINDDVDVVQNDWLSRLMGYARHPDIDIVAPKVVQPETGNILDAGQVLGLGGISECPVKDSRFDDANYMGRALSDMNCSSISGICFITKTSTFKSYNGFNEEFSLQKTTVLDYCLRVREKGGRILLTPHSVIVSYGKRPSWEREIAISVLELAAYNETEIIWKKWLPQLARDPAYNQNLSLSEKQFACDINVPMSWDVCFHSRPRIIGFPTAGAAGDYRVIVPLASLSQAAMAQTSHVRLPSNQARILTPPELERLKPDSIVLHMAINDAYLQALQNYKKFNPSVFRIFTADDLISDIPEKSSFYKKINSELRDSHTRLRKALSYCDRLIVSTDPLAEAFSDMISDIRVVPNRLQRTRWQGLRSLRRQGNKPRVGWAGAQQHQGDLEIISDTIKATCHEVDWIFFGMCLDEVKPFVKEYYDYVPIHLYPETLASMNLDLAVAPLEDNPFNRAKSNLRLLEYGVLGWPVICSDVLPYRGAPVVRVRNQTDDWVSAIRSGISDLSQCATRGDRLKNWVEANFMIEDHLDEWLGAFTP